MAEVIAAEDATADQLRDAADAQASLQLRILELLPTTKGDLIMSFQGEYGMSEVNEAISQLADARKVVRSGDLIEATP
jgi:DNA-directed RNA polymerase subunit F